MTRRVRACTHLWLTIPATAKGPTIGFLAHVDTAPPSPPPVSGRWCIAAMTAVTSRFPMRRGLRLSPGAFPCLATRAGDDIITASGTTLPGDRRQGRGFTPPDPLWVKHKPGVSHPRSLEWTLFD